MSKAKLINNSYDTDGWYLSPEIETKTIEIQLSNDDFIKEYLSILKIPLKYRKILFVVFKYRDKAGVFDVSQLHTYLKKESIRMSIAEFKQSLYHISVKGLKHVKDKIIFYDWDLKVWRINKLFLYNIDKDWCIKLEIKNK